MKFDFLQSVCREPSWEKFLKEELSKPYMQQLQLFLDQEKKEDHTIYPQDSEIFNAFLYTPYDQVKVVILGQDPYHGKGLAEGLCFSTPTSNKTPPSLKNIFKELKEDLHIKTPQQSCLKRWAKQGVLLLNTILTVREKTPRSHYGKGWELFTDAVIERLWQREDPIVFMLWGKVAQEKLGKIIDQHKNHVVLMAAHPSPYSAHNGFLGCCHFSKANKYLVKWGKIPVNWGDEGCN